MPIEVKPLVKRLGLRDAPAIGPKSYEGELDGRPVVATVTGMGTALATGGTERLLDARGIAHVVVVGITGGVENDTTIGTLVMPETVVNSHTDEVFTPTPLGDHPARGILWTTDVILSGAGHLDGLRAKGVVGLDMETAAIAKVCVNRDIPWSVFRVISDRPDDEVDEAVFKLSNQDGTPNPANIARYMVTHPGRLPAMARMGKNVKLATERAAEAAIAACRAAS